MFNVEEDHLLVPGKDGQIAISSTKDGLQLDSFPLYHSSDSESDEDDMKVLLGTPPSHVCMSPVYGLVAVTYRNSPVTVWDMETLENRSLRPTRNRRCNSLFLEGPGGHREACSGDVQVVAALPGQQGLDLLRA